MLRLNLGSAHTKFDGWLNADIVSHADVVCDLGAFPWPWKSGTVSEILASHILEHFTRADGERFIAECQRILKPKGQLHLAVPDLDLFMDCHLSGDFSPLKGYEYTSIDTLMGGGAREPRPEMRHYALYNWRILKSVLEEHGFRVSKRGPLPIDNPAYHAISLYVTGVKA